MIVYGTKTKEVLSEKLIDPCSACGSSNTVNLHIFQKYAHVFWIPFFPAGKTAVSECSHCKQVLKLKEMPASFKLTYANLKPQAKTPLWMFSGIAVVAVLMSVGFYSEKKKDERNAVLILAPKSGDLFEIKTKDNQYTLYKVDEVQGDSIFIRTSEFESNKISGLADLKRKGDSAYSEDVYSFSKAELKQMLADDEIIDIDRK